MTVFATPVLIVALAGCGINRSSTATSGTTAGGGSFSIAGTVFGGSQPIGSAAVSLYAVNESGYGKGSQLLGSTTSNALDSSSPGSYSLAGDAGFCSPANVLVYVVATGGNSGAGTNPNISLMAALGPCNAVTSTYTHIVLNEASTVAAVWALAPFMSDYAHVATSAANVAGLAEAFHSASQLVNLNTGAAPGSNLPLGTTIPQSKIYTLADILAACVNSSGGVAGSTTNCGILFSNTSVGSTPSDTVKAALVMAQNPSLTTENLQHLFGLIPSTGQPYQPALSSVPNDLTLAITYAPSTLNAPSALAIDGSGNVWLTNTGNNSLTVLANSGGLNTSITGIGSSLNVPSAIAIDASGDVWVTDEAGNQVTEFTSSGTEAPGSPYSGGGLSTPTGIAIDNQGYVWISNGANNALTKISGTTVSEYTPASITSPIGVAINPH